MNINGLFDIENRYKKIDKNGDILVSLKKLIPWEEFRSLLESTQYQRISNAGRKPYDIVMMFKILIIQSLYNLSDEAVEMQILDRLSFMRFLEIKIGDDVPDSNTIWTFREKIKEKGLTKELFNKFDEYLSSHGFQARTGQIVDASIVSAPKQHNTKKENELIKEGKEIEDWSEAKKSHKDVDARWTKKNNKSYFGYKNHIVVDSKNKFIRNFDITDASVHDSQVFEEILLKHNNSVADVWADAAYISEKNLVFLKDKTYNEHIIRKGYRDNPLSDREKENNKLKSKVRARVEHIFGAQLKKAGNLILRTIGKTRAYVKIGLRNLAYNIDRYRMLVVALSQKA